MAADLTDKAFNRVLGQRLAAVRKERGFTQDELAEAVGMDTRTIQRAESGASALSVNRLRRLAAALGLGLEVLFQDVGAEVPAADDPVAVRVGVVWARIPESRRRLALELLEVVAKGDRG